MLARKVTYSRSLSNSVEHQACMTGYLTKAPIWRKEFHYAMHTIVHSSAYRQPLPQTFKCDEQSAIQLCSHGQIEFLSLQHSASFR